MKKQTKSTALARASALLLLSALPSFASALYIQVSPSELFGRQDSTCGDSSYAKCNTAGLPDDFCCPADHSCIALAGKTTALCCPSDSDCNGIRPIPCDISLQDKGLHPENVVMTNALTGTIPRCANLCCPFGYSCDGENCILNPDQNAKPLTSTGPQPSTTAASSAAGSSETVGVSVTSASRQSASATASATASGSGSGSATATGSGSQSSSTAAAAEGSGDNDSDSDSSSSSSGPSAGLVAGGVVGGIAAAVFLGMLVWFFIKREAKRKNEAAQEKLPQSRSSRSSSFGNIINNPMTNSLRMGGCPVISKPIVDEGAMRSDFGRKVSPRAGSFNTASDEDIEYEREFGTMGARPVSGVDMNDLHSVPRSPPTLTNNRAVSSMYAVTDYADDGAYQAPLKMPSARHFGGQDNRVSVGAEGRDALGSPISDYGGQRVERDPNGAYIDVFADSNVPLTPPQAYTGDRMTRFTDIMDDAQDRRR
ncbi:hypothetical protein KVR01_005439 [Diaporthe batatas]|uniref:uncharacterized protein n=1 Tax=Diaporthe batatas TaxID=748121 RepID=UPI001D044C91|nr:uncharacterized protein KVR01_005439 [Diaporthe batatas]KAG8165164.1 hypothetical protein KVR01_005439 [Diaporthe batatas]